MEKIKISTSFNIELDFETPEFHKRLFAWLIDLAILFTYFIIANKFQDIIVSGHKASDNDMPFQYNISAIGLIFLVPVLVYHLFFEIVMNGQSIGKKLVSIRVISEDGGRPALHQYLIRWITRPFDFFFLSIFTFNPSIIIICFLTGLAALLVVLLTKKNQRLGDLAAGTLVIKMKMQTDINDMVFFELEDTYKPRYSQVMRLSDRDMNTIKGVLNNLKLYNNFDVAVRISEKLRSVLNITDYEEPVVFLETLLKDYNYFSNQI